MEAKAEALASLGKGEAATEEYRAAAEVIRELANTIADPALRAGFLSDAQVSSIVDAIPG